MSAGVLQLAGAEPLLSVPGTKARGLAGATPSAVLPSYWKFAEARQDVYFARLRGDESPWTSDPIVQRFKFTNAYRAADRTSQSLLRIQYRGVQDAREIVFRTILFRVFNSVRTWQALEDSLGELCLGTFSFDKYCNVLDRRMDAAERVYSPAYIIPPPAFGEKRKHANHLRLVEFMFGSGIVSSLLAARSLKAMYEVVLAYPSLGPFLAYQLTIDLNYSAAFDFEENDFVVAGPGARSGIRKCFVDTGGHSDEDVIRWMVDTQEQQAIELGLSVRSLFGRRLKLIDCQNLFCETDKYARVAHPDESGIGGRQKIKQRFSPAGALPEPFFPPKWGINGNVAPTIQESDDATKVGARI